MAVHQKVMSDLKDWFELSGDIDMRITQHLSFYEKDFSKEQWLLIRSWILQCAAPIDNFVKGKKESIVTSN